MAARQNGSKLARLRAPRYELDPKDQFNALDSDLDGRGDGGGVGFS